MNLDFIKSDWKKFGKDTYIFRRLYDCDPGRLCGDDFVPSFHGGLFLRLRNGNIVDLFNNAGVLIMTVPITINDAVHTIFWCQGSNIGFLFQNGDIKVISLTGETVADFKAPDDSFVKCACGFYNGITVITYKNQLCMFDLTLYKYQAFNKLDFVRTNSSSSKDKNHPQTVNREIMAFAFYRGIKTEGYIALSDGAIVSIGHGAAETIAQLEFVPTNLEISPNAELLAARSEEQIVIIPLDKAGNENSTENISPSSPSSNKNDQNKDNVAKSANLITYKVRVNSLAWLTDESFLATTRTTMHFFQLPDFHYEFDPEYSARMVIQDIDNVRIFADSGLYLMQKVPKELTQLFRNKHILTLLGVLKDYNKHNIESYKNVKNVPQLQSNLEQLASAALVSLDPDKQHQLLYLITFIDKCTQDANIQTTYVTTLNQLVLLNSIRSHEFGFTTTAASLKYVSPASYVDIAMSLNLFGFAMDVCTLFDLNPTAVVEKWSFAMLKKNGEPCIEYILNKLLPYSLYDYRKIASYSIDRRFARDSVLSICDRIFPVKDRVMLMARVPNSDPLETALRLKDGDAIIAVVVYNRAVMSPQRFATLLSSSSITAAHYALFRGFEDAKVLMKIANFEKRLLLQYIMMTMPLSEIGRNKQRLAALKAIVDPNHPLTHWFDHQANISMAAGKVAALREREKCASGRELLYHLAAAKDFGAASKIAKEFGISPRNYAIVCSKALANNGMWNEFETFTVGQNSLLTEDLIELCFDNGNKQLGYKYINDVPPEDQRRMYELYGYPPEDNSQYSSL